MSFILWGIPAFYFFFVHRLVGFFYTHKQVGGDLTRVVNYDVNGNIIPDLSKVTLPKDLSLFVYQIYLDHAIEQKIKEQMNKDDTVFRSKNSNSR